MHANTGTNSVDFVGLTRFGGRQPRVYIFTITTETIQINPVKCYKTIMEQTLQDKLWKAK